MALSGQLTGPTRAQLSFPMPNSPWSHPILTVKSGDLLFNLAKLGSPSAQLHVC